MNNSGKQNIQKSMSSLLLLFITIHNTSKQEIITTKVTIFFYIYRHMLVIFEPSLKAKQNKIPTLLFVPFAYVEISSTQHSHKSHVWSE